MTCAKKVDTMLLRKLFYLVVLLQVAGTCVLYIMIKCKDKLRRIFDLGSTRRHKAHGHRPCIVMCEASVRLNLDVVAASNNFALWKAHRVALKDLLRQRLWRCHFISGREVRRRLFLRVRLEGGESSCVTAK